MGLGSRISRYITTNLLRKFIYIEFTLSVITAFVSIITYITSAYYGDNTIIIYGLSILVGLLIGMEIPIVMRLNDEFEELKVNVSSVMEKDYYGSLLGGIFFAFVGLPYLGLTYTPFILGAINFLVACMLIYILWQSMEAKLNLNSLDLLYWLLLALDQEAIFAKRIIDYESLRYKDRVILSEQTKYQRIVITQSQIRTGYFLTEINN